MRATSSSWQMVRCCACKRACISNALVTKPILDVIIAHARVCTIYSLYVALAVAALRT